MTNRLVETEKLYGMEINMGEPKVMRISKISKKLTIQIEGETLEQVDHFKYLGSITTEDAKCTKEVKARIAMAKNVFSSKRNLFTNKNLSLELKKRLAKCYVWSIASYGAETWILRKIDCNYLESFEMWIWRRMEKIKWIDKVTNEKVLNRIKELRKILRTINKRGFFRYSHNFRDFATLIYFP